MEKKRQTKKNLDKKIYTIKEIKKNMDKKRQTKNIDNRHTQKIMDKKRQTKKTNMDKRDTIRKTWTKKFTR